MNRIFSCILILLFSTYFNDEVVGQNTEKLKIQGKILSKETGLAVTSAHIRIQGTTNGTITNSSGEFALNFSSNQIGDTLVISSIAFKTFKMALSEQLLNNELEFFLQRGKLVLEELHVEDDAVSSYELVQKAVSKIEENYAEHPVALTEFYREFARVYAKELSRKFENERKAKKKNQNLDESYAYNVTEGVFEVYKYPYFGKNGRKKDLVKMIKGRRLEYEPQTVGDSVVQSIMMKFKHKGGPHDMLRHDPLKDPSDATFLHKNAFKKYKFKTLGLVEYNGRMAFKVEFDQKDGVKDDLFKGELYIDTANYAFVHMNFRKSPKGIDYQSFGVPVGVLQFISGIDIKMVQFKGDLTYQEYRGKWYPEYHRYAGEMEVKYEKERAKKETKLHLILKMQGDLMVTGIDVRHAKKFSGDEEFKKSDHMDDFVGEYNDEFWEAHNYILPSKELMEQINDRKRR